MNVEVTDACNIRCDSCVSPHGKHFMGRESFATILSKIPKTARGHPTALHWRGESCLHPALPEIASICETRGVGAWVSTNTVSPLLSDRDYTERLLSRLKRIEVCVDGYNQETLTRYRVDANWNILLRNVEIIGSMDTRCQRDMRVLMFKYNEGHEGFFRRLATENNFDRVCFSSPIIGYKMRLNADEAREWLAKEEKYRRYRREGNHWLLKQSKTCIPHICISVHGTAHPCGHDWKLEHSLGNLLVDDWDTIQENLAKLKPRMMRRGLPICEKWCCLADEKVVTWKTL